VLLNNGDALVKEGPLNAGWTVEQHGVDSMALSGDRIGVLLNNGQAWLKVGALNAGWNLLGSDVDSIDLSADLTGLLFNNGDARIRNDFFPTPFWDDVASNVDDLVLQTG
jgi:hypothetical protein